MSKKQPELFPVELPFKGSGFADMWNEWLQWRKESRFPTYKPTGLKRTFNMLKEISANDELTAIKIIEQSMAQGYRGLFPLKNIVNGQGITKGNIKYGGANQLLEELRTDFNQRSEAKTGS